MLHRAGPPRDAAARDIGAPAGAHNEARPGLGRCFLAPSSWRSSWAHWLGAGLHGWPTAAELVASCSSSPSSCALGAGLSREIGFGAGHPVRLGLHRRLRPDLRLAVGQLARAGAPDRVRRHRRQHAGRAPQRRADAHLVGRLLRAPASRRRTSPTTRSTSCSRPIRSPSFVAQGGLFGDVIPLPDPDHPRRGQHRRRAAGARDLLGHRVLDDPGRARPSRRALALGQSPAGCSRRPPRFRTAGAPTPMPQPSRPRSRSRWRRRRPRASRRTCAWSAIATSRCCGPASSSRCSATASTSSRSEPSSLNRGTALEVGLTFAATAVPSVVLGPLAGVMVDRWDRRRTMIACDVARAGARAGGAVRVRDPHRPRLRSSPS